MTDLEKFTLPAGTLCKRGAMPFELVADTVIRCHPDNWPDIRDGFVPSVGNAQRFDCNQVEQMSLNPCQAAGLSVMSTTKSSSLVSRKGDNQSRTCVADKLVSTIQVESKQCQ